MVKRLLAALAACVAVPGTAGAATVVMPLTISSPSSIPKLSSPQAASAPAVATAPLALQVPSPTTIAPQVVSQ